MILKDILQLHNQRNLYVIEDDEGVFLYRKHSINRYSITIPCRNKKCSKSLRLMPINDLRYIFGKINFVTKLDVGFFAENLIDVVYLFLVIIGLYIE